MVLSVKSLGRYIVRSKRKKNTFRFLYRCQHLASVCEDSILELKRFLTDVRWQLEDCINESHVKYEFP